MLWGRSWKAVLKLEGRICQRQNLGITQRNLTT
jgi:hypothetical protein